MTFVAAQSRLSAINSNVYAVYVFTRLIAYRIRRNAMGERKFLFGPHLTGTITFTRKMINVKQYVSETLSYRYLYFNHIAFFKASIPLSIIYFIFQIKMQIFGENTWINLRHCCGQQLKCMTSKYVCVSEPHETSGHRGCISQHCLHKLTYGCQSADWAPLTRPTHHLHTRTHDHTTIHTYIRINI